MVPEIIRYQIPSDQASVFVHAYAQAGEVLKESSHCLGFELLHSAKDPELFLLLIHWDSSEGHLNGFRRSPLFPTFFAHIRPYIPNILEMEHYEHTQVQWTRE